MKNIFVCLSLVCLSLMACLGSAVSALPAGTSAPTATVQVGEVWVVCKNANVRPNPSADDRVLDWKLKGDRVIVLEWVNGWARIGDAMYINGWLLCPVEEGHAR